MFEKIPTAQLDTKEWLQLRKTGIGGSDAGAVCGVNPYSSPMKVFHDKTVDGVEEKTMKLYASGMIWKIM